MNQHIGKLNQHMEKSRRIAIESGRFLAVWCQHQVTKSPHAFKQYLLPIIMIQFGRWVNMIDEHLRVYVLLIHKYLHCSHVILSLCLFSYLRLQISKQNSMKALKNIEILSWNRRDYFMGITCIYIRTYCVIYYCCGLPGFFYCYLLLSVCPSAGAFLFLYAYANSNKSHYTIENETIKYKWYRIPASKALPSNYNNVRYIHSTPLNNITHTLTHTYTHINTHTHKHARTFISSKWFLFIIHEEYTTEI